MPVTASVPTDRPAGVAPPRSGAAGRRDVVAVVVAVFAVVVIVVAVVESLGSPRPPRSNVRYRDGGAAVLAVAPGDLLDRAGVTPGDTIVAVDGQPLGSPFDLFDKVLEVGAGAPIRLTVVRAGAELDLTATARPGTSVSEILRVLAPVTALVVIGAGVYLVRPRRRETLMLLLFCSASAINDIVQLAPVVGTAPAQRLLTFAYCMTSLVSPALLLHLFVVFPERGPWQRRLALLLPPVYAVQLALGLDYYLPTLATSFTAVLAAPRVAHTLGALYGASVVVCYAGALASQVVILRTTDDQRRRIQARFLTAGLGLLVVLYVALVELPLRLSGRPLVDPYTQCLLDLIVPVAVAAAIVRGRMFGIDVLLRHGLVYATATAAVAGVFIGLISAFGWATDRLWADAPGWAIAAAAALAAVLFHPARGHAQTLVDRALYRRRYSYRKMVADAGARLGAMVDADAAAEYIRRRIEEVLAPAWVEVAILTGDGPGRAHAEHGVYELDQAAADVLRNARTLRPTAAARETALTVPMVRGDEVAGAILLGRRLADVPYLPEDVDFLETLASLGAAVVSSDRLLAERATRERLALLGTAASGVIHELKNPLGAMRSTLAVLRRRLPDDPQSIELTHIVESELERLKERVTNVLTFVRQRPGQLAPLSVADLLSELLPVVRAEFSELGVQIHLEAEDGLPPVTGDPERLRQAFLNLLLNAREAMPDGGRIRVAVRHGDGSIVTTIEDQGRGFSAEALARASEPFFTTKPLGTGLGLANARRTVEACGGRLVLANGGNGGARVRIELPEVP